MQNRYLVLTELFLPTKGGTAVWFDEVYRRLGGKKIHIVTADVPGAREYDVGHPNTVHRLNLRRVSWLRPESLGMYLKFFGKTLGLALTNGFDAIHAGRALPEGLVAWLVARLTGRPVVIYAHGEELTGWGKGSKYKTMRFVLRHADKLIANSNFTRDTLVGMGVTPSRIVIIHPGVDTERFRPGLPCQDLRDRLDLRPGTRLLLSVGRLQRRKGFDRVIESMPRLLQDGYDLHYAIVGIGDDRGYLEELAGKLGVQSRVSLLGHVPIDDLPRWYNASDLFVMVNREIDGDTEGFGMVFLEAAACARPCIAGIAGGTGSAVIENETGFRVDGRDPEQIAAAIARLLGDRALSLRVGSRAEKRVREELTWKHVAERTERVWA